MKYCISIEETVVGNFEVEANSKEEALKIAKEKYDNCEFVNEPGDLVGLEISVADRKEDYNEWRDYIYTPCI